MPPLSRRDLLIFWALRRRRRRGPDDVLPGHVGAEPCAHDSGNSETGSHEPGSSNRQCRVSEGDCQLPKTESRASPEGRPFLRKSFSCRPTSMEAAAKGASDDKIPRKVWRLRSSERPRPDPLATCSVARGETKGAVDIIALLAVMIDQMAQK